MLAERYVREGQLALALEALQDDVRRSPSEPKLRVFLFQLLVVLGQWERALKQLQVAATLDPEAIPMAQTYRELIRCEVLRTEVFLGKRTPLVVGEPEPWLALLIQALHDTGLEQHAQAEARRAEAFALAPASTGVIAGEAFDWIADADSRLGPVLEVVLRGRYHWVPFSRLEKLEVERPTDLRDLVWLPATLHFRTGDASDCFIPARYPASHQSTDDAIRMARKTEWLEVGKETVIGLGQRMFVTDRGEAGLFDVGSVELASSAADESAPAERGIDEELHG